MMAIETRSTNLEPSLATRFAGDLLASGAVGFVLSWFITPMDSAITENMSGKATMKRSLQRSLQTIFTRPHQYMMKPAFGIVYGVIGLTYVAKNVTDSFTTYHQWNNETAALLQTWTVFGVNMSLCVFWRDPKFSKIFGTKLPTKSPIGSYICWVSRDIAHAGLAVVAPDYVERRYNLTQQQWKLCAITFPLLTQIINGPLHLMGLDYYNIKESGFIQRLVRVRKHAISTILVRAVRMIPTWSIGLIVNREIRDYII
eukprot:279141_1